MNVLLRAPNWIGDAVMALPGVAALGARGDVRLTVLAPPIVRPVFDGVPGVSLSPIDPRIHGLAQAWAAGRALAGDDTVGLLLPRSFSSALVLRIAGVPRRIGRRGDGRAFLLTDTLPPPPRPPRPLRPPTGDDEAEWPWHRWRDYAEIVELALGERVPERYPLYVSPGDQARADALLVELADARPLVGLNAGANGPARRWPAERFGALGRSLREVTGARIAVLGGPKEIELSRRIAGAIPAAASLAGRTSLKVLMGVLRRLDLLVTNDSGPMHLAAALGTPLLDLCGAADERVTGPRGAGARVLREYLFCSPCVRNACPYDLECMRGLTVARVLAESLRSLGTARAA